jgi:diguanylate cyclase (GGDEF)-like protein
VEQNLPDSLNVLLQHGSAGEELCRQAMRRGGVTQWRQEKYPQLRAGTWQIGAAAEFFGAGGQESWTAVALESRGDLMGMILFPHPARRRMSASELRVLLTQALQLAKTLDNYVLVEDALHRSRESEMMTQVGQAISSHLDPDEVLKAIHLELGKLFDTGTFYVAFLDGDMLHYEFETVEGIVQPKRAVRLSSSLAAHILESGEPLLIRSAVAERKKQLHITSPGRGAKSFLGVPVKMSGRTAGVLCALNFEREFVYSQRDLEVLQTAAGQLSVAMENALLFSEANRRAQYLSFLNTIAGVAISTQETGQMLGEIVRRIEENFGFDHVSVGLLDYARKDIEIRAEAGGGATLQGHRIPIGVGIMGRVARSNETAVVQHTGEPNLLGVLNGARSVLCMPLHYGGTLLGLLNVESLREDAFTAQDVLLFNTLADLLSTALNNSLAFQELQQQAITDGLTGLKTRRYFLENLHAECRRAKRSGRPFAVLLLDLDKFKQVNDTQGHLQGDLVLARVGWILEMKCRQSNVVARYGGDEFVVLMPESEMEPAETLADRLRLCFLSDPMLQEHGVTGSFGVAVFPQHGETAEEILRTADDGMYQSKHNGGNCVSVSRAGHGSDPVRERGQYLTSYLESFCTESILDEESAQEFVATVQRALEALPEPGRGQLALDLLCRMVRVAERRENDRGSHGEDVAAYAEVIGRRLDLAAGELQALHTAGLLHDIGKLFIPASILNSTGMLGTAEYQLVMTHSRIGARLAGLLSQGAEIQDWILHHHERMDGSGYPDQLAGENISLGARILGICDAYVIMTSEHPFSAALSPAEALHELEISPQLYDPALVAIFASHVRGEGTPHAILT